MAISITQPLDESELSALETILFVGTADNNITQAELWADDRWLLDKASVSSRTWSISYAFNAGGTRRITAKGFDAASNKVSENSIWLYLEKNPKIDLDMDLSPNFKLWELMQSTTAELLNIDNTPTLVEIEHLKTLCNQVLQSARDEVGALKITSGFRCEDLNKAVRGASNSAHRLGFAADVIPVNGETRRLAEWIVKESGKTYDQIILEFGTEARPDWIHISVEPRNRKQVLRATRKRGQVVYDSYSFD